ncbi:transposase [Acidovorax sp. 100]|uniref:transposase n=1 Tax=Acidovorax sp. 100 TaxID=2135635 RepID=UPI000EFA2005|nr:transposase [Acidovorax sp. 100]
MKKYQTEFKLEVVRSFLAGEGGAKLLARRWSVPEEKIRTWASHYRLHGIDGLRPKRSTYSAQFKLQVLSHQDREQLSSRQVAAIYDIRNPTKSWSGDAISIKAACRRARAGMKNSPR